MLLDYHCSEANRLVDDSHHKLACVTIDCAFDDILTDIVEAVRA